MSTIQRLTLIGMYNFDNTLFDNLSLPDGYDKDIFLETLLLEHGEKCVLYTDIDFMKFTIGAISRKWELEFERIYEALTAEYNPIENYDRNEYWEDHAGTTYGKQNNVDYTETRTPTLKTTTTYGKTDTNTQTTDSTNEKKVAAFNSSTYEPSEKNESRDGTRTLEQRGNDRLEWSGQDKTNIKGKTEGLSGTDKTNSSHTGRVHGNIGVMTAASMVSEIIKQRKKENLYAVVTDIFAKEIAIGIY